MVKFSKGLTFTVFGIVRFFKMNIFCLKIRFSLTQHALSDFCFYSKTGVFSMRLFFYFVFIEVLSIFTRNETFCEHKGLLKVFGTMRLTGELHKKFEKFQIFLLLNFLFFQKCFRLRKMGFLLFPVEEEWFSRFMRIPSGIFWRCKIEEILTIISFYSWFSYGSLGSLVYSLFGFRQKCV